MAHSVEFAPTNKTASVWSLGHSLFFGQNLLRSCINYERIKKVGLCYYTSFPKCNSGRSFFFQNKLEIKSPKIFIDGFFRCSMLVRKATFSSVPEPSLFFTLIQPFGQREEFKQFFFRETTFFRRKKSNLEWRPKWLISKNSKKTVLFCLLYKLRELSTA